MGPKSPSLAFEPTPALAFDKENFSPLMENPTSSTIDGRLGSSLSKEVHFFPVLSPIGRAQSLATSVPFLEPVSSASQLPRHTVRIKNAPPEIDMNAYMEQSRSLLESQRLNFEKERDIFERERRLWNAERAMLKSRIANLEDNLSKTSTGRRRSSNDAPSVRVQSFRKDVSQKSNFNNLRTTRGASEPNGAHHVWETPDMGGRVTRVFSNDEKQPQCKKPVSTSNGLPSIAEGGNEKPVSLRSNPVPITVLDSSLDGITLKSAGLESSFVKVSSPSATPPPNLPSPGSGIHKEEDSLRVKVDGPISPADPILVRNAGHTPMEFGKPTISETPSGVESLGSPERAVPPPPQASISSSRPSYTALQPSERSDSYFSSAFATGTDEEPLQTDGDVELKGPLIMKSQHAEGQENLFLDQLDAKLLAEAQRPRQASIAESDRKNGYGKLDDEIDDEVPRLMLKKSMNFGSAFGSMNCGKI